MIKTVPMHSFGWGFYLRLNNTIIIHVKKLRINKSNIFGVYFILIYPI